MKKITATFPDDAAIDFNIFVGAIDLRVETIDNPSSKNEKSGVFAKHRDPNMTTSECILKHYTPAGMFTRYTAMQWLRVQGFAETSVSNGLHVLRKNGLIRDLGAGKYQWVKAPEPGVRYGKKKDVAVTV